jgi:hypothetical protein
MSRSINGSGAGSTEAEGGTMLSRRRPGRRDDAHPSLIPLLRGTASPIPDDLPTVIADRPAAPAGLEAEEDGLDPVRGIIFGVALSVPIWAVLILGACRLLSVPAVEIALSVPIWAALGLAACHLLD